MIGSTCTQTSIQYIAPLLSIRHMCRVVTPELKKVTWDSNMVSLSNLSKLNLLFAMSLNWCTARTFYHWLYFNRSRFVCLSGLFIWLIAYEVVSMPRIWLKICSPRCLSKFRVIKHISGNFDKSLVLYNRHTALFCYSALFCCGVVKGFNWSYSIYVSIFTSAERKRLYVS